MLAKIKDWQHLALPKMKGKWIFTYCATAVYCTSLLLLIPICLPGPRLFAQLKAPDATWMTSSVNTTGGLDLALYGRHHCSNPRTQTEPNWTQEAPGSPTSWLRWCILDIDSSFPSSGSLPVRTEKLAPHRVHFNQRETVPGNFSPSFLPTDFPRHSGSIWPVQNCSSDKPMTIRKKLDQLGNTSLLFTALPFFFVSLPWDSTPIQNKVLTFVLSQFQFPGKPRKMIK